MNFHLYELNGSQLIKLPFKMKNGINWMIGNEQDEQTNEQIR